MIKNDRQYAITKAQATELAREIEKARARPVPQGVDPSLHEAALDAMKEQLEDMNEEITEYEALREGTTRVVEIRSLDDLPRALIQARIASGLTQRELAERLEVKEQQIQRYEATDYASASLSRVLEVTRALGLRFREESLLSVDQDALKLLHNHLRDLGFDRKFIRERLIPRSIASHLEASAESQKEGLVLRLASWVGRVLGLEPSVLTSPGPLALNLGAVAEARFKTTARTDLHRVEAYTLYVYFVATLGLRATSEFPTAKVLTDPRSVREAVVSEYGSLTFRSVLRYIWDLGIPVIPLNDPGNFHGACWRIDGRNVIVIKQRTSSSARLLFDLLHELRHAGESPNDPNLLVVESSPEDQERALQKDERVAGRFAGEVMLQGRAEELAQFCVTEAKNKVEFLKAAVSRVAKRENIPVGFLANYMAFRLAASNKIDWWGTAANLQPEEPEIWEHARDECLSHWKLGLLDEPERELLSQALWGR